MLLLHLNSCKISAAEGSDPASINQKNKDNEDNRETDKLHRRYIIKINYLTGTVTFDWTANMPIWTVKFLMG